MCKKVLVSLVVLGVVMSGVGMAQAMGGNIGKKEGKEITIKRKEVDKKSQVKPKKKVAPKQKTLEKIPADWKTWYSGEGCGDFEIKYPHNWEITEIQPDEIGCGGELNGEGTNIRFVYSTTCVLSFGVLERIEAKMKESPERVVSFSVLKGIREVVELPSGYSIRIELGFSRRHNGSIDEIIAGGIYCVFVSIRDPLNKGYEKQVKQILSSFKIRGLK